MVASSLAVGGIPSAYAISSLMISADGTAWKTVSGDPDGNVSWDGYVGGSGRWNVSLGGSLNSAVPQLNLDDVVASSRFGGSLTIRYIATDLTLGVDNGMWINTLSAMVPSKSSLQVNTYFDSNNGKFETTPLLPLTSQSLNYTGGASITDISQNSKDMPLPPFSMMIEVMLSHRFGGETVFSDSLVDPPTNELPDGGSTLVLAGLALGAIGLFGHRRSKVA